MRNLTITLGYFDTRLDKVIKRDHILIKNVKMYVSEKAVERIATALINSIYRSVDGPSIEVRYLKHKFTGKLEEVELI